MLKKTGYVFLFIIGFMVAYTVFMEIIGPHVSYEPELTITPIEALVFHPEDYVGKRVKTIGFYTQNEPYKTFLNINRMYGKYSDGEGAVFLDFTIVDYRRPSKDRYHNHLVVVEGTFTEIKIDHAESSDGLTKENSNKIIGPLQNNILNFVKYQITDITDHGYYE